MGKLERCEEPEEELAELDHFSMMQLEDGLVVYADEDSLPNGSQVAHQTTQSQDAESQVSLLSELDAQYRLLIDKYEALLDARCRSLDLNGPPNGMTSWTSGVPPKAPEHAGKKVVGDYPSLSATSDAESAESGEASLSSGFSEMTTERCFADQGVQTDLVPVEARRQLALDLAAASAGDPLGQHFSRSPPEYKKLFAEIFAVLKRTVTDVTSVEKSPAETPCVSDGAQSPRKSSATSSCRTESPNPSPIKRKLKTNLDISKLCDVVDRQGPTFQQEEIKVRLPGGVSYAEAVRRGKLLRRGTTDRKVPTN